MKVLIISDTHTPTRVDLNLRIFLENKKYDLLIHCGDFDRIESYEIIKNIAKEKLYCVHGNSDDFELKSKLPEKEFMEINWHKTIIIHWHQVYPRWDKWLINIAIENNVKILFCGHTHKQNIHKYQDGIFLLVNEIKLDNEECIYIVNPGSLKDWEFLEIDL